MSNYIALTKVLLKNSLTSFSSGKKGARINSKVKNTALMLIIIISLLPMAAGIGAVVWASYPVFMSMGQEGLILGAGLMMLSMVILFFGIFYVMNIFYFSKDVESLLPLPLRPSTIMAAKFTVTLLYEYLTELLLLLPILLAYGIASKAGIIYYLYSIIAFLTLPIIPIVYAGVANMVLMRVTNISKNRDQFRIIGGVIAMFIAIFGNMKLQNLIRDFSDPEQVKMLLTQGNNSLLDIMTGIFPANKLLALGLVHSSNLKGLVNILLYLGISVLFMGLFLTMGESWYFKGLVGISETKSKRKKLTSEQFDKGVVKSSIIKSYTLKELKLLVRTPVYFINCVMMNFILPVVMLIPMFANPESAGQMASFQSLAQSGSNQGMVLAIAFAAVLFASGSNGITATAISREGTNIFVTKFIPVNYLDQIMGKVMAGVLLGMVALCSLLIAGILLFKLPFMVILLVIIIGFLGVLFTSFMGILIDLNYPKLYWDNEQKAVKQNMNLMVSILVSIALAAVVVVPTVIFQLSTWLVFAAIVLIFGFVDAVLFGLIKSAGVKLFDKLEG